MPSYFRQVPNFEYVSRTADAKNIDEYITVKNLFKRGVLKEDIFKQMRAVGIDQPESYVVGNALNSINPNTGQPEFFFKKLISSNFLIVLFALRTNLSNVLYLYTTLS